MRVFALSDLHVDYDVNAKWVERLSTSDYREDVLILAGDLTDIPSVLEWCLSALVARFRKVLFVPGNHDLWVARDKSGKDSLQKLADLTKAVTSSGASMDAFHEKALSIVPLFGWYDYSFGVPSEELKSTWMDFHACRWPSHLQDPQELAAYFDSLNVLGTQDTREMVITFSHFLPRIDLMPSLIPMSKRIVYPVLGTTRLDRKLRQLRSKIHVYGHSHVNRRVQIDGVSYINNAFGYPSETRIASKRLVCIHDC